MGDLVQTDVDVSETNFVALQVYLCKFSKTFADFLGQCCTGMYTHGHLIFFFNDDKVCTVEDPREVREKSAR